MRLMTLLGLLIGCESGEKVTEPVQEINEDLVVTRKSVAWN